MTNSARRPTQAPAISLQAVTVSMATAANGRPGNEDAIGLDGWVLYGDDVNPMTVARRMGTDYSVAVAVTDGLSGAPDGDRAAQLAARLLTDRHRQRHPTLDTLIQAFGYADETLHHIGNNSGLGAAAAMLIVRPDGIGLLGNVGDARVYLLDRGYLAPLSRDDRLEGTATMTRCLGGRVRTSVAPHPIERLLKAGDRLLLCSDGLSDVLPESRIAEALMIKRADKAVAQLVLDAKRGGGGPNVTVVVVDLEGVAAPAKPPAGPPAVPQQAPPPQAPAQTPERRGGWFSGWRQR